MELEHSASSDEAVRERIASLPPEVSEVSLLSKLQGKMTPNFRMLTALRLILELKADYNWFIANGVVPPPRLSDPGPCTCPKPEPNDPGPSNKEKCKL